MISVCIVCDCNGSKTAMAAVPTGTSAVPQITDDFGAPRKSAGGGPQAELAPPALIAIKRRLDRRQRIVAAEEVLRHQHGDVGGQHLRPGYELPAPLRRKPERSVRRLLAYA
jgi:hypothetical protein